MAHRSTQWVDLDRVAHGSTQWVDLNRVAHRSPQWVELDRVAHGSTQWVALDRVTPDCVKLIISTNHGRAIRKSAAIFTEGTTDVIDIFSNLSVRM